MYIVKVFGFFLTDIVAVHYGTQIFLFLQVTLFFPEFIIPALTSTFTADKTELYNPVVQFRGQQQKQSRGQGKSLCP